MGSAKDDPHVEHLIDRQIREWDLRRHLAEPRGSEGGDGLASLPEGPWVSFSKQLGSEARAIARRLGEKLGWQIFDREIVEAIAKETRSRERVLSRLDERAVGRFDDLLSQLLVPDHPGQITYLQELGRVIWALARQGRVILLGRGANWFLDARYGLRVRAIAPFDLRVQRVSEREKLSSRESVRRVRAVDAARAAFIRQVYHRDIDDPMGYDIVVNTETLAVDAAADAVLSALRAKLGAAG